MFSIVRHRLWISVAVTLAATGALAQESPFPAGPAPADSGFFRPQPDPSLTRTPSSEEQLEFELRRLEAERLRLVAEERELRAQARELVQEANAEQQQPAPSMDGPAPSVAGPSPIGRGAPPPAAEAAPATNPAMENAERQMDRVEGEAAQARARSELAPAPINGAFTGSTSERDR